MKKFCSLLISLGLLSVFTACEVSYVPPQDVAATFVSEMNYYYNNMPGEEISLVKRHGHDRYNYIVVFDDLTGEYNAYNLTYYYPGMTMDQYLSAAGHQDIYFDLMPIGSGYYEGYDGTIFENTKGNSKDLEKLGAFKEEKKITKKGEILASKFGLSESRGIAVARLGNQWEKLSKKRSMTSADADAFSKELLGFSLQGAMKAFKKSAEGNEEDWKNLMEKAAGVNETTPEHMNDLMNDFLKN